MLANQILICHIKNILSFKDKFENYKTVLPIDIQVIDERRQDLCAIQIQKLITQNVQTFSLIESKYVT